jgi:cytochrome c biogenesis protein CcmG, thiol:disulfide interchange protein DsbE
LKTGKAERPCGFEPHSLRQAFPLILIMGLTACAGFPTKCHAQMPASDEERKTPAVPEIRMKDVEGNDLSLHELLAAGPVLLDFWALWCRPCLKELPELDKLREKYAASGLTVIAVNTDMPVEVNKVKPFVRARKYGFRVLTDVDGEIRRKFQVNALPTALLIRPDGTIAWSNQGYRPGDEKKLEQTFLEVLSPK